MPSASEFNRSCVVTSTARRHGFVDQVTATRLTVGAIVTLWALRETSDLLLPDFKLELFNDAPNEITAVCLDCDEVLIWREGRAEADIDWPEFPTVVSAADLFVKHLAANHLGYYAAGVLPVFPGADDSVERTTARRRYWQRHGGVLGESFALGLHWPEGSVEPDSVSSQTTT